VNLIKDLRKTYKPRLKIPKCLFQWKSYYNKLLDYIDNIKGTIKNSQKQVPLITLKKN